MTGPKEALGLTALPGAWRFEGKCSPATGDEHHPTDQGDTRPAKKRCQGCPVRDACLAHAIEHDEPLGIWGGLTRAERNLLKRRGQTSGPVILGDNEGRLRCPHCGQPFTYPARYARHLEQQHPKEGVA